MNSTPRAILAAGNVYIDRLDSNGNPTGYRLEGSTADFKLSPENEEKELLSRGRDTYGQAIATVKVPGKTKISMTMQTPSSDSLAMAVLGTATSGSQTAGSVDAGTPEDVVAKLGYYVELDHKQVSNVVVKDATETTTYVENTDYIVDEMAGMIKVLSGGSITDGETLHLSYDYAAYDYADIVPNTDPSRRFKIKLAGKNFADGKMIEILARKVVLATSGDLGFGGDDFLMLEMEGTCEMPDALTDAVTIRIQE